MAASVLGGCATLLCLTDFVAIAGTSEFAPQTRSHNPGPSIFQKRPQIDLKAFLGSAFVGFKEVRMAGHEWECVLSQHAR